MKSCGTTLPHFHRTRIRPAGSGQPDAHHRAGGEKISRQSFHSRRRTPNFINFQGPAGTYRPLPVENMFVDALWEKPPFNGGLMFSNKIVIVGPMAEIFHDIHTTPFGEMPGPEIQAQIMAALLHGDVADGNFRQFQISPRAGRGGLALVICLGIPQALLKGFLLAGATVAFFVVCQVVFNNTTWSCR